MCRWGELPNMYGSSPLARGLRGAAPRQGVGAGIIPARAGFTTAAACPRRASWDHPRSRGVYHSHAPASSRAGGSSPLARGLPWSGRLRLPITGIIPARAGFTPAASRPHTWRSDHPRSRGVYFNIITLSWIIGGSSPLARGLRARTRRTGPDCRIIPARAGFTARRSGCRPGTTDHPRSRGVYRFVLADLEDDEGSSPLARGLRAGSRRADGQEGIIPARAGFTRLAEGAGHPATDHPRSRGVYRTCCCCPMFALGSSPLARGLQVSDFILIGQNRIIPARAGFTKMKDFSPMITHGSSPLARGLPGQGRS